MFRDKAKDGTTRLTGVIPQNPSALSAYPVGSIFLSVVSTSPATLFGGTWSRFAQGRVLIGVNESDVDYDTTQETGGSKTRQLLTANLPPHAHDMTHTHVVTRGSGTGTAGRLAQGGATDAGTQTTAMQDPTNTGLGAGDSTAFSIVQPYITCYMWRRTA